MHIISSQLWLTINISVHLYIYAERQYISLNNRSTVAQNLHRGATVWDKEQAWENVMGVRLSTQTGGWESRLVLSSSIPGNFRTLHTFMLTEPHYWHSPSHHHLDYYHYDTAYEGRILDFLCESWSRGHIVSKTTWKQHILLPLGTYCFIDWPKSHTATEHKFRDVVI